MKTLYLIAYGAFKVKTSTEPEQTNVTIEHKLEVTALVKSSAEEARDLGLDMAKQQWPEVQGWQDHTSKVAEVLPSTIPIWQTMITSFDSDDVKETGESVN
jgi:hypothetical protein